MMPVPRLLLLLPPLLLPPRQLHQLERLGHDQYFLINS
jgi:hypothetical protein